jgi:hypothetical protein
MPAQASLRTRDIWADGRRFREERTPACSRNAPWALSGDAPSRRRTWTELPEAALLLSDCAANPPATRMVKVTDLTTYHARRYTGARVRKLRAIHRAESARLLAEADAAGNYAAFDAHCRLTVQQAIADALFHAAIARSAACDARALEST